MQVLSSVFAIVGVLGVVGGGIGIVYLAFCESIRLGFACLLIPPLVLMFTVTRWDKARKPFYLQLGGALLIVLGSLFSPQ